MSDPPASMHDEDLTLDEGDADGVTGGSHARHGHVPRISVAQAEREGFAPFACTREGTVMKRGGETIIARP